MRTHSVACILLLSVLFAAGCYTRRPPQKMITYLALERPREVIKSVEHQPVKVERTRGGFYFLNANFRPAPDLTAYLEAMTRQAGTPALRNADITFRIPFAWDILLFGYNSAHDTGIAVGK